MKKDHKVHTYLDDNNLYWFIINRPERRNAIDYDVMDALQQSLTLVQAESSIRAFVITGNGEQSFCSGGDLAVFHALRTKDEAYSMLTKMGEILHSLMTLPVPTYALINGIAIGGGCEIASACDQRWATPHAKVGFVQGNLGITTGWGGASMLFEKIPSANALQMLTSSSIYKAEEAEKLGFIQKIVPIFDKEEIGGSFVASAGVLRSYKEALIRKWREMKLRERMLAEIEQCSILWEQDEHHEAVARFLDKK